MRAQMARGASASWWRCWRAFRARLGDHVLMYLISIGLSLAASFALAVPLVMVTLATVVPAIFAATRAALVLVVWSGQVLLPPGSEPGTWFVWPRQLILDGWVRWDSGWYLLVAAQGLGPLNDQNLQLQGQVA